MVGRVLGRFWRPKQRPKRPQIEPKASQKTRRKNRSYLRRAREGRVSQAKSISPRGENELKESVKVDSDGKILFTSKLPAILNDERTEFVLRDSGGNEKTLSIRIPQLENREIAEVIKLSLGNTPQEAKRGDVITLMEWQHQIQH